MDFNPYVNEGGSVPPRTHSRQAQGNEAVLMLTHQSHEYGETVHACCSLVETPTLPHPLSQGPQALLWIKGCCVYYISVLMCDLV